MEIIDLYLSSPWFRFSVLSVKIFGVLFFFSTLGLIIFCLKNSSYLKVAWWQDLVELRTQKALGAGATENKWQQILKRLESHNPPDWKLAIIEAENLLEEVLTRLGFGGESFGERLEKITIDQLPSLFVLKEVHQTRNNIIHDPDYRLEQDKAKESTLVYGRCLQELGAL